MKKMKIKAKRYERILRALALSDAEWTWRGEGTRRQWRALRRSVGAEAITDGWAEKVD